LSCGLTCTEPLSVKVLLHLACNRDGLARQDPSVVFYYCFLDIVHRLYFLQPICRGGCQGQLAAEQTRNPSQTKTFSSFLDLFSFRGGDSSCDDSKCSCTARGGEGCEKLHWIVSNVTKEVSSLSAVWHEQPSKNKNKKNDMSV
jgi:hypothetical protein